MAKELPLRNELPESATWDLTKIFASDTDWQTAYDELNERLVNADFFAQMAINSGKDLYNALQYGLGLMRDLETLYVYASMKSDQDTATGWECRRYFCMLFFLYFLCWEALDSPSSAYWGFAWII